MHHLIFPYPGEHTLDFPRVPHSILVGRMFQSHQKTDTFRHSTVYKDSNMERFPPPIQRYIDQILAKHFPYEKLPSWVKKSEFVKAQQKLLYQHIRHSQRNQASYANYQLHLDDSFLYPLVSVACDLGASGGMDGKLNEDDQSINIPKEVKDELVLLGR